MTPEQFAALFAAAIVLVMQGLKKATGLTGFWAHLATLALGALGIVVSYLITNQAALDGVVLLLAGPSAAYKTISLVIDAFINGLKPPVSPRPA